MTDADAFIPPLRENLLSLDAQAHELRQKLDQVLREKAFVEGKIEAFQEVAAAAQRTRRVSSTPPPRVRALSGQWKTILQSVALIGKVGFGYADLRDAAKRANHDASDDTLRSQMSLYIQRGWVARDESGRFHLTEAGRVAADAPVAQSTSPPANTGSSTLDEIDDDVPF